MRVCSWTRLGVRPSGNRGGGREAQCVGWGVFPTDRYAHSRTFVMKGKVTRGQRCWVGRRAPCVSSSISCLVLTPTPGPGGIQYPGGGGDVLKGPVGPQCSAWVRYEVYPPCVWEWVYGVCVRYKVTHLGYIYIYTYEVQHRRILEEWFSSVPPSEHGPPTRLRCAERSWLCGGRTAGLQEGQTGNTPRTVAVDQRDRSPQSARSLDGNGRV